MERGVAVLVERIGVCAPGEEEAEGDFFVEVRCPVKRSA